MNPADPAQPGATGLPTRTSAAAIPLRVAPGEDGSRTRPQLPQDFAAWYEAHREVIYRYVRFRVATREAAEDVTSEVFLKALRFLGRYDPSRAPARAWLLHIARNAVADHLRMLKRRRSLHVSIDRVPDLVTDTPSPEERILREERIQKVMNCNRTLREPDQEILSLRYGAGLSNHEIAQTLGITDNAAAVRVHRALARLKAALDTTDEMQ
jgi:RNA polymerase sigma-70 factor (ECF subfamily)